MMARHTISLKWLAEMYTDDDEDHSHHRMIMNCHTQEAILELLVV